MVEKIPSDLLELLKSVVEESIEEYDIEIVNNEKGQGYVGEIFFLTLTHRKTREKHQLTVKQEQNASNESKVFFDSLVNNEMNFYESVWPFLQDYYKKASGKDLNIVPKCFGTLNKDRKRIILENIKPQGYMLYDRTKPFDDAHFRTIFKTYGIYHAISMALREKDYQQYSRLVSTQKNLYEMVYSDAENSFCKDIIDSFREVKEFFDPVQEKHIREKLRFYEEAGIKLLGECVNQYFAKGVIIHGDCWSNNLMFKYDDQGKLQNVKLLDFQAVCHGSPVFDLSYCMYSGASEGTLNKLDDYLQIYHNSLSETLSEFGLIAENIYSFKTFKEEWKVCCKNGLSLGLILWKIKLVDKTDIPDYSQNMNPSINISDELKECYKKRVRELAFHFYDNDFF